MSSYKVCPLPCSLAKHRIGTKRHRVCLEIPQEVSQSELFPKEELSSGQFEMTECQAALAPMRPTHSSVRQVEDGLPFPGELTVVLFPQS
jgi:jumonji domain-containing protein 2